MSLRTVLPHRDLVVDTNVLFSVFEFLLDEAASREDAAFREMRTGAAWLLLMYCNRWRSRTVSLEELRVLAERRLPNTDPVITARMRVVLISHDVLLPRWCFLRANQFLGARSNAADSAHVEVARECGLPLVTSDGWSPTCRDPADVGDSRIKARRAGVVAYTPIQFLREREFFATRYAKRFFKGWERERGHRFLRPDWCPAPNEDDVRDVESRVRRCVDAALEELRVVSVGA